MTAKGWAMRLRRALVAAACVACNSPQLEVGPAHPASAEAASPPAAPIGEALEPSFEPQPAAAPSAEAPAPAEHRHGAAAPATKPAPAAADPKPAQPPVRWTCPMHPEIIRSEPGNCPICGMKLQPVRPEETSKGPP